MHKISEVTRSKFVEVTLDLFSPPWGPNNFCSMYKAFWHFLFETFTSLHGNHHYFSQQITPECRRRFELTFSMVWSVSTLKGCRRMTKIVHLPKSMQFGAVISSTWSVGTLKSIRRKPKVEHLETGSRFKLMFSVVWSVVNLFSNHQNLDPPS